MGRISRADIISALGYPPTNVTAGGFGIRARICQAEPMKAHIMEAGRGA